MATLKRIHTLLLKINFIYHSLLTHLHHVAKEGGSGDRHRHFSNTKMRLDLEMDSLKASQKLFALLSSLSKKDLTKAVLDVFDTTELEELPTAAGLDVQARALEAAYKALTPLTKKRVRGESGEGEKRGRDKFFRAAQPTLGSLKDEDPDLEEDEEYEVGGEGDEDEEDDEDESDEGEEEEENMPFQNLRPRTEAKDYMLANLLLEAEEGGEGGGEQEEEDSDYMDEGEEEEEEEMKGGGKRGSKKEGGEGGEEEEEEEEGEEEEA